MRYRGLAAALLPFAMPPGCDTAQTGVGLQSDRVALRDLVSGEAAASLGPDGLFQLTSHDIYSSHHVSEHGARPLALAVARTHGPGLRLDLEADHGAAIDFESLRVCGRTFFAESPLELLGPEVPAAYHRIYGSQWLVSLCDPRGTPAVSVSVSVHATNVTVVEGAISYSGEGMRGGEFSILGIPRRLHGELPVSPERAVVLASQASRRRVASVPRLILPLAGTGFPQTARWRMSLESPGTVVRSSDAAPVEVRELFTGVTLFRVPPQVQIATIEQPALLRISWRQETTVGMARSDVELLPILSTQAKRRASIPVSFEPIASRGAK